MRTRLGRRPSASMVVALIALFVAIGGTATAASKLIITCANVKNQSLTGCDIKNGSLTGKQVKNGSLTGKQIKKGSLTGTQIKNDSLMGTQIKESSLAKVPTAATADNANQLGGKSAASYEPAGRWALIQGTATGATVLAQSGGFGTAARLAAGFYVIDAGDSAVRKSLSVTPSLAGGAVVDPLAAPCGGTANNPGGVNCPQFNDNNHVEVRTFNNANTSTDSTFYVVIGG